MTTPVTAPGSLPALSTRQQGALAIALALSMGAGPLCLYAVTALSPMIAGDLGLTTGRLGTLAAVMYGTAAATALGTGRLVDAWSSRRVLAVLFLCCLVALAAVAGATGYAMLLAAIVLSGAVQSASNPVTNKLIALHVPAGRRGTIVGVKQSGIQITQFFAGAVMPAAALLLGWRWAIALGLIPISLGWVLSARFVPAQRTALVQRGATVKRAQTPVTLWQLAIYSSCNAALVAAVNVHVPLYAFEAVGLPAAVAGGASGLIGGLGIVARVSWGRGAEGRRTFRGPLLLLAAMSLLSVLLLWGGMVSPLLLLAGLAVFAASAIPGQAVAMLALVASTDRRRTGSTTGLMMLALYIGFMTGPFAFGLIVERTGTYAAGWAVALGLSAVSTLTLLPRAGMPGRASEPGMREDGRSTS